MNAYELADELLRDNTQLTVKAAYMLRQQADRIAELKKEVKRLVGAKPITHGKLTFCKNCGQQDPYAQTKPLSDEEILDIFDYIIDANGYPTDVINLAKAIEERHGIK